MDTNLAGDRDLSTHLLMASQDDAQFSINLGSTKKVKYIKIRTIESAAVFENEHLANVRIDMSVPGASTVCGYLPKALRRNTWYTVICGCNNEGI